jgi:EmrB/QacA subfamily drug resistance transporter
VINAVTRKGLILALVCMAQFIVILDFAIVNVALPSIQEDLDMKQSAVQWIVIAYGLFFGGFLLLGGKLGDLLGRRKIFLSGLAVFTVASTLAGLADSAGLLIGARALQGFGAALVAPSALSILAVTFTEGQERNKALGIFGATGASSATVGVIASGLLTDGPGWRWIFFINVPVGIALIGLALRYLRSDSHLPASRQYDFSGAATVTGGLLLFVYGLNRGVDHGWSNPSTLALFAGAAVLLASFIWIESRAAAPLVPFKVLKNRMLVAADAGAFLLFGSFFSFVFLGTLMMQQLLGYSPTRTGLSWLATSLPAFVAAFVGGNFLVTRVGVRRLLIVGMLLLASSAALLVRISPDSDFSTDLMPAFVLAGLAIGLSAPSVQIGALSGVRTEQAGLAAGLVETMREIGGAVGVAAVTTALVSRTSDGVDLAAQRSALADGFQSAFYVIVVAALAGAFVASLAFPRSRQAIEVPVGEPAEAFSGAESVG